MRPIRFGVTHSSAASPADWKQLARKVEDLGYDVLLLADHMGRQWAPLLAALAAAEATTRLRVGTQVIANDFRHPAVLAKEVATLDLLTGGRFEFGIGVGHPPTSPTGRSDYAQLGMEMDEPVDFEGRFFRLKGVEPQPRPAQQPRPPIMVAGAGPRMLRLMGREADIVNIAPRPPTKGTTSRGSTGFGLTISDELALIREGAGDRYEALELCVFADRASVTDDPAPEAEALAAEFGISLEALHEMPHTLIGPPGLLEERILEHREKYGISYRIIPGGLMEAFAPVVRRLAGK